MSNIINETNEKLCKLLGIDHKDVSEVYVKIKAGELPEVVIRKFLLADDKSLEEQDTYFRLVPLESL